MKTEISKLTVDNAITNYAGRLFDACPRTTAQELFQNVIRAGATKLTARVEVESHELGELIKLTLRDNGCGTSPESLSRMTSSQWKPSLRETEDSAGLGFYAVAAFAKKDYQEVVVTTSPEGVNKKYTMVFTRKSFHGNHGFTITTEDADPNEHFFEIVLAELKPAATKVYFRNGDEECEWHWLSHNRQHHLIDLIRHLNKFTENLDPYDYRGEDQGGKSFKLLLQGCAVKDIVRLNHTLGDALVYSVAGQESKIFEDPTIQEIEIKAGAVFHYLHRQRGLQVVPPPEEPASNAGLRGVEARVVWLNKFLYENEADRAPAKLNLPDINGVFFHGALCGFRSTTPGRSNWSSSVSRLMGSTKLASGDVLLHPMYRTSGSNAFTFYARGGSWVYPDEVTCLIHLNVKRCDEVKFSLPDRSGFADGEDLIQNKMEPRRFSDIPDFVWKIEGASKALHQVFLDTLTIKDITTSSYYNGRENYALVIPPCGTDRHITSPPRADKNYLLIKESGEQVEMQPSCSIKPGIVAPFATGKFLEGIGIKDSEHSTTRSAVSADDTLDFIELANKNKQIYLAKRDELSLGFMHDFCMPLEAPDIHIVTCSVSGLPSIFEEGVELKEVSQIFYVQPKGNVDAGTGLMKQPLFVVGLVEVYRSTGGTHRRRDYIRTELLELGSADALCVCDSSYGDAEDILEVIDLAGQFDECEIIEELIGNEQLKQNFKKQLTVSAQNYFGLEENELELIFKATDVDNELVLPVEDGAACLWAISSSAASNTFYAIAQEPKTADTQVSALDNFFLLWSQEAGFIEEALLLDTLRNLELSLPKNSKLLVEVGPYGDIKSCKVTKENQD